MNNSFGDFDYQSALKRLVSSVTDLGGFNPQQVKNAGLVDEAALRAGILAVLQDGAKTGHDVIQALTALQGAKHTDASRVYPLLEQLLDTGLVSAKFEKDRRVFRLTAEGKDQAKQETAGVQPESSEERPSVNWPKWIDLTATLPRSLAKLASVSFEVSSSATKAQQEEAAAVIDEARKQLHAILAKD